MVAFAAVALAAIAPTGYTADAANSARVVSHGSRSTPAIALTFDDGISPTNCRRILAILQGQQAPATFFPVAEAMRLDPAFWRLVAAAGDPVGDHTLTHPQMASLSPAAQFKQIDSARRLAESILGRPLLRVFRPPYGAYDAATLTAAAKAGFDTALLWDVSDRDTSPRGTVAEMLVAAEHGADGSIILLHCGPNATPYLLGPLITYYRERGFDFVTVPRLIGVAWAPGPVTSLSSGQILGSLSPLPPIPAGGPIVGPNGIGTLVFPSDSPPEASSAPPGPATTPRPTATPGATLIAAATGTIPPTAPPSTAPGPTPTIGPPATSPSPVVWIGGALVLGLLVGAALAASRRVRSRGS